VPDVEYTPHENTFLVRKRTYKWVKFKNYEGRQSLKAMRALT